MLIALALAGLIAQQPAPVTGQVTDATGLPLAGVTITISDTDRFAVTDERGAFALASVPVGATLMVRLPGFSTREVRVPANRSEPLRITLGVAKVTETVVVRTDSAASARTETRLTALDVVRTPGTQADLMRSLALHPGATTIDDGAGVFVRGGDVSEVRVLLDGVVVHHPYRYETPTGGFRGAIDPFLTSGASFTTGGFSAEYANSLSAIVALDVRERPAARQTNLTIGLAGVSAAFSTPLGSRFGLRLAANRTTPSLLFAVNPSPKQFDRLPGGWDVSSSIAAESSRAGQLRVTLLAQRDHVGVELDKDAFIGFLHSGTQHEVIAARWTRAVGAAWLATASVGADRYAKTTDVGVLAMDQREWHRSGRVSMLGQPGGWRTVLGADWDVVDTSIVGQVPLRGGDLGGVSGHSDFRIDHQDWRAGVFTVLSREVGRWVTEGSVRADRFDASSAIAIDPRASVRMSLGGDRSLRLAAGQYRQAPSPTYFDRVRGAVNLSPMSSTHVVLGYEQGSPRGASFGRVEVYRKWYDDLPLEDPVAGFSSTGYGHAVGADTYLHRVWPRLELTLGASVLRARRRWTPAEQRDRYELPAGTWTPDFEIPYSVQAVVRVPLSRALSVAGSWRTAAGRPFTPAIGALQTETGYEPQWGAINAERLPRYERLDVSINLLTPIGERMNAVFFASVDNVLDRRNTFELAYTADYSQRRPVESSAPRAFYIGCSITR